MSTECQQPRFVVKSLNAQGTLESEKRNALHVSFLGKEPSGCWWCTALGERPEARTYRCRCMVGRVVLLTITIGCLATGAQFEVSRAEPKSRGDLMLS